MSTIFLTFFEHFFGGRESAYLVGKYRVGGPAALEKSGVFGPVFRVFAAEPLVPSCGDKRREPDPAGSRQDSHCIGDMIKATSKNESQLVRMRPPEPYYCGETTSLRESATGCAAN